jgi:hypothetical protein
VVLASSHAMRASVEAVDRLFRLAGPSAVMADHSLQRCFRDIHTADTHLFWSDSRGRRSRATTSTLPNRRFFPMTVSGHHCRKLYGWPDSDLSMTAADLAGPVSRH